MCVSICIAVCHRIHQVDHPEVEEVVAWNDLSPPEWVAREWNHQYVTA